MENDAYGVAIDGEFLTLDDYGSYMTYTTEDAARRAAEDIATRFNTTRKVYRLIEIATVASEKVVRWSNKKAARKAPKKKSAKAKAKAARK